VDAYWKREKVNDVVINIKGVIDVENHLAVVPTKSILDKDIAKDIEAALKRNVYVNAENITVKVEDGIATLTGTLSSYYARSVAENAAAFTPGVIDVNDKVVLA
jgi:osmotically-inducible protein OsmY